MDNEKKLSLQENKIKFIIKRGVIRFTPLRSEHHLSRFHDKYRNIAFKKIDNSKDLLEF